MNKEIKKTKNQPRYYSDSINIFAHTSVPWQQTIIRDFLGRIDLKKNAMCLDVGTGIGNNLKTIVPFVRKIEALDISPEAIKFAQKSVRNTKISLKITCADAKSMPYESGIFDLVICTEVLEHCSGPEIIISECSRVLRPGGYAIFSVPNYFNLAGLVKRTYDLFHHNKTWDAWGNHEAGIENLTTPFWLNRVLNKSGFSIVEKRGGDLIRSWFPFLRRRYKFIDRHPFLGITKKWPLSFFAMNYFCLAKKM